MWNQVLGAVLAEHLLTILSNLALACDNLGPAFTITCNNRVHSLPVVLQMPRLPQHLAFQNSHLLMRGTSRNICGCFFESQQSFVFMFATRASTPYSSQTPAQSFASAVVPRDLLEGKRKHNASKQQRWELLAWLGDQLIQLGQCDHPSG